MTTTGFRLGSRRYDLAARVLVMGVIDPGASMLTRAEDLVAAGADVLDADGGREVPVRGGATADSRPGALLAERVAALSAHLAVPVSVATVDAAAAEAAGRAGAILMRVPAVRADDEYLAVVARTGASVALGVPGSPDAPATLATAAGRALAAGVARDQVVLHAEATLPATFDAGVALLAAAPAIAGLGYPLLMSFCEEAFGTRHARLASTAHAVAHGCRIVRTHDVTGTVRVVRIIERLLAARHP